MSEPSSNYDRLREAVAAGISAATVTVVRGEPLGAKLLVLPEATEGSLGSAELDQAAATEARALIEAEKSETRTYPVTGSDEGVDLYIETHPPAPTLLIFGAVHVAQALTRFAKQLGFRVIVS